MERDKNKITKRFLFIYVENIVISDSYDVKAQV